MPRVSDRHESMSSVQRNVSVGLGTHHVSSSVMEVSAVSDEPGVFCQVWGRWATSCLERDLMGQEWDIFRGIHLSLLVERCSANQRACSGGLPPVSVF